VTFSNLLMLMSLMLYQENLKAMLCFFGQMFGNCGLNG